ncbi:MAG: class I SAM-dependent methyltransferase [Bacteroidales bacterium]
MDHLNIDQLKQVPWNSRFISGPEVPPEPLPQKIPDMIKVPFMKRDRQFSLFYTWLEIVRLVGNNGPLKILDAACGRGQIVQILKFYGHDVTGADIVDCFCADKTIPFVQTDLDQTFPFPDNSFDAVINSTALHYLKSSEDFFSETKRVLKPNGRIIFSISNISNLGGRYYFFRTGKITEYSSSILTRKNFLYPHYIFELLKSLGFTVENISGNVPISNFRIKLFALFFGKFLFKSSDPVIKYSNAFIISAILNK